jgi:hypothetical protein
VITNRGYLDKPLDSAPVDAQKISAALQAANFSVTPAVDVPDQTTLVNQVINPFLNNVKEGDVVVIYYFGHGFSHGADNFLVPTQESTTINEADLYDHFLPERAIRQLAETRHPGILMIFLDACRVVIQFNNPGVPSPLVSLAVAGQPDTGDEVVSFAADYGSMAYAPAQGTASYYTDALAKSLPDKDVEFSVLEKTVNYDVEIASHNLQRAWTLADSQSLFYFVPTSATTAKEEKLWEACLQEGTRAKVEQFLHENRASPFAADARQWLKDHPEGQPGERLTFTHVSPLAPEASWNGQGKAVALPRLGKNFAVGRTLRLPPGEQGAEANRSLSETVAAAGSVIATQSFTARDVSTHHSVVVPYGVRLSTRAAPNATGGITAIPLSDKIRQEISLFINPQKARAIPVGVPLAEIALSTDDQYPDIVSDAALSQDVEPAISRARLIGWASISTAASDDPKIRAARSLQATYLKFALVKLGVAESKITIVENDASNKGDLRLRLYGEPSRVGHDGD